MENSGSGPALSQSSVYEFTMPDIDGTPVELSKYRGNVLLIVNVACACGLTSKNYAQLNQLHERYSSRGLSILAFPCNQFGGQESGTHPEIKNRVRNVLGAKFDLFGKVEVNGNNACGLYKFLRERSDLRGGNITWNFGKFLIDRQGNVIKHFNPQKEPLEFETEITALLG